MDLVAADLKDAREDGILDERARVLRIVQWCRESGEDDMRQVRDMVESGEEPDADEWDDEDDEDDA